MSAQENQRDLGYNPKELRNLSYLSGMLTNEIMLIILVYKGLFSLIILTTYEYGGAQRLITSLFPSL